MGTTLTLPLPLTSCGRLRTSLIRRAPATPLDSENGTQAAAGSHLGSGSPCLEMDVQVECGNLSRHRRAPRRPRAGAPAVSVDHDWPQERVIPNDSTDIRGRRCPCDPGGITGRSAHTPNVVSEPPCESYGARADPSADPHHACPRRLTTRNGRNSGRDSSHTTRGGPNTNRGPTG